MEKTENKYVKWAQKDYSMIFKLSVVQEYETSQDRDLYLSLVIDAYSKKIMGYDLSYSLDTGGQSEGVENGQQPRAV